MELKSLECKLAMVQVRKYEAGERLSDRAMEQLQEHLSDCAGCREAVQQMRAASHHARHQFEQSVVRVRDEPTSAFAAVMAEVMHPAPGEEAAPKPRFRLTPQVRATVMSAVLAGVLVAMSTLASQPTRLFGDRALAPGTRIATVPPSGASNDATRPAAKSNPPTVSASPPSAVAPTSQGSPPESRAEATLAREKTKRVSRPTTVRRTPRVARPAPRAQVRRPNPAPRPTARPSGPGVRVFDENGNLVR